MGRPWPRMAADLGVARPLALVVPWYEIVLGALLISGIVSPWAEIAATVTLLAFTVVIVHRLLDGSRPPCACFGSRSKRPLGRRQVARNVVLLAVGVDRRRLPATASATNRRLAAGTVASAACVSSSPVVPASSGRTSAAGWRSRCRCRRGRRARRPLDRIRRTTSIGVDARAARRARSSTGARSSGRRGSVDHDRPPRRARPSVPRSVADPVATHLANATGTVERARGGPPYRRPRHRRLVEQRVRRDADAAQARGPSDPADVSVRREQAGDRGLHQRLRPQLGHRHPGVAVVQRVRPAPAGRARVRRGRAGVRRRRPRRPAAPDRRRRHARRGTSRSSTPWRRSSPMRVVRRVTDPEPVNLAFGTRTDLLTVIDLLEAARRSPGRTSAPTVAPGRRARLAGRRRPLRALFPDIDPVPLDVGLAATVAWMRSTRNHPPALRTGRSPGTPRCPVRRTTPTCAANCEPCQLFPVAPAHTSRWSAATRGAAIWQA